MAKLYFRYGAMNSGKSTVLLQVAFNYEERGQRVLVAKPAVDTKGDTKVVSRLGLEREVDFLITPSDSMRTLFAVHNSEEDVAALLIDEAQFLTKKQVNDLIRIAAVDDVPVLTYGIRTDFRTVVFPGSARLMEVAHTIEELKTICRCGKKAVFNGRKIGEQFVFSGDQVSIEGGEVGYEALCAQCYLAESHDELG